jgi:alkylated DNA repair dioxygenase AlkB
MLEPIDLAGADLRYDPRFLDPATADGLLDSLLSDVRWDHHVIRMFGREVPTPRRSAWFGDPGARYAYSGLTLEPRPWPDVLIPLRDRVEKACRTRFNAALANLYRDGRDSMGWHADDEPELGQQPRIASLSLGAERRFTMRPVHEPGVDRLALDLRHGSLLLMAGATQRNWQHALPKTRRRVGPRINLTFRFVTPP